MKTDVLIVGAGFAGAATAFHLSQLFTGSILVVESENQPGLHASGLNASMVIQAAQSKPVRQLFAASRSFYQQHTRATGFNQTGSLLLESSGVLEGLQDPALFDSAGRVINAAGAWSGRVGQAAGASEISLRTFKRHLFLLKSQVRVDPDSPSVWNLEKDFYFRPRSDGILFCVCDAELSDRLEPDLDPEVQQYLAEVLWKELPALKDAERDQAWCCFRTFTSDGLPLIGPDPSLPAFYWVCGLAGYGMSASWEIGRLAALSITGDDRVPSQFDPGRFN